MYALPRWSDASIWLRLWIQRVSGGYAMSNWSCSSWVALHQNRISFALQVFPIETREEPARHLLAAGRLAEALGYDAFFVSDHPAWGLEGWTHMAALAVLTERIGLGINVACVGYRHPVMTARLAADIDNLSQGRLILGLGIGWDSNEFANLGLPFPSVRERQALLEETIEILRGVWGAEPFTFHGRYARTDNARVSPPPLQTPAPPLLIAGGGERVTLRQVARYADACQLSAMGIASGVPLPDDVGRKLAILKQHCDTAGRPFDTILRTHFTGWLMLGEDEARLRAKVERYVPQGLDQRFSGVWQGFAMAATPEQAVAYYQALADVGIQYFIVEVLDAADEETIHLLAEHVVPRVKVSSPHSASSGP
jgi:alkanesulfonate monooxygenase SsuD/methylene tetrahydromethanopterin reductase-like flavin-dependent oxidoreductase (luciferase family)